MAVSLCCRRLQLNITKSRLIQQHRNGYIVLLPEISAQQTEPSALLNNDFPDFSNLDTEKCLNAVGKNLLDVEHSVRVVGEKIEKEGCKDVIKEVVEPLEKSNTALNTSWGIVKALYLTSQTVMPSGVFLGLHERARRARLLKYYSKPIYTACKECDESKMTEEEHRIIAKYVLEGRLSGLELSGKDPIILDEIHSSLAEEKAKYRKRVEYSTAQFSHTITDPTVTRDLPENVLKIMAFSSKEPSQGPWKVSLNPQVKSVFLEYCPNRDLRWNVWQASTRVASMYLDNTELHNSSCLEKIRSLRRDEAKLLGYETYADLAMETKMAGSVENADQVLTQLLSKAKAAQDKEIGALQTFAWERGFEGVLQLWDIPYWQKKQKKSLFNFQEEMLREYFPLDKVLSGLMGLCERLFGLKFVEAKNVDKWHPDVRYFQIFEDDSKKPVAGFYIDPYMRSGKVNVGEKAKWMVGISPAARVHKNLPLAAIVLNLTPPMFGKPSLLAFTDVQGLFEKFGHMLQHVLSNVTYAEVSGLNNVEWDAVGICSNFMTNWLLNPQVLESVSGHYSKNEKLPDIPWLQVHQHMAGFDLCEELFKARLDLELYSNKAFWQDIMKQLWPQHYILPLDKWNSLPCHFNAIVTEEWAAAYFSHVWSRMVAADVYSAFTEEGADIENIGTRFRDTFLAFGGSCHPSEVFRRFRGRDPSPNAFLKSLGLQ